MRRDPARRWLRLRVGLFFLAAAVWIVGLIFDLAAVRWAALAVGFGALVLGLVARRNTGEADPPYEEG